MSNKKKVLSIVVGVFALLLVAVGTVFVLSKLNVEQPKKKDEVATSQLSAAAIIEGLQANTPSSLVSFSSEMAAKDQFKITAQLSNKPFSVAIPADAVLVFTPKDKKSVSDAAPFLTDAKKFFESQGLRETSTSSTSASYENQSSLCQVQIQTGEVGAVTYGCTASDALQKEYATITQLIEVYNRANPDKVIAETSLASAERTTRQKDSVEGVILSLLSGTKDAPHGKILLFGAVAGNWQYVADLTTGKSSGKANVPSDAVSLIKDKKWNGVLAGLVGLE